MTIHSPYSPSAAEREFLEKEGHRCPVYLAVKDGVAVKVAFEWGTTAMPGGEEDRKVVLPVRLISLPCDN